MICIESSDKCAKHCKTTCKATKILQEAHTFSSYVVF